MKTTKTASGLRALVRLQEDSFLTPDELALFLWIYTEASKFNWKGYAASISKVENGTLVKRRGQERIIEKFVSLGWLIVSLKPDEYGVPYRWFFVDMKKLANEEVLCKMFKCYTDTYSNLLALFRSISEVL